MKIISRLILFLLIYIVVIRVFIENITSAFLIIFYDLLTIVEKRNIKINYKM